MSDKVKTELAAVDLSKIMNVGMSKVDPADVLPPQIVLVQKMSDMELMVDKSGKQAKVGQFFHTGRREILDTFDCYVLFAAKSQYIDNGKYNPDRKGQTFDQYQMIGVLKDDKSLFGMRYRSSALWTLSPLFTAVTSLKAPMFAFNCKFETKELQSDKGKWHIPVCRVGDVEQDSALINELYLQAKAFDSKAEQMVNKFKEDEDEFPPHSEGE